MRTANAAAHGVVVLAAVLVGLVAPAARAGAHPLGNFSVNEYQHLAFSPDRLDVSAVINTAEIPTLQDKAVIDTNHDGDLSAAELAAFAAQTCTELGSEFLVTVGGPALTWSVTPGPYTVATGPTGLPTARLTCGLSTPVSLHRATTVTVENRHRADRIGWHEMTATATGVHLVDSPLPERSVSAELQAYPAAQGPSALLDVRTATLRVEPGAAASTRRSAAAPKADALTGATVWAERGFERMAAGRLTPVLATLAILLALLLGAGHAALPGHGKTVLAAYIAGRQGRPRDALTIGATVTATHTGGVLVLGALISTTNGLAGERLLSYLGVISGVLIVVVGVGLLIGAIRRRPHGHDHGHTHHHGHTHDERPSPDHSPSPDHGHRPLSRWGLAGMGIAGGLVPSPSALVVLLAALSLGRVLFGVVLVVAYGFGMAATLTAAGLLLLSVQRRVTRPGVRLARLATAVPTTAPLVTAALVVVVGCWLVVRAAAGLR